MDEEGEEVPAVLAAVRQELDDRAEVLARLQQILGGGQMFGNELLDNNILDAVFGNENNIVENYVYSGGRPPQNVGSVIIDNSVREIPRGAFQSCFQLTEVDFGNMLDTIEQRAFESCALRGATMPSVRSVGVDAFYRC